MARPRLRRSVALLLAALAAPVAAATETAPFAFEPPSFLRAPTVTRSLLGATYSYLAQQPADPVRLLITAIPTSTLAAEVGPLSAESCTELFSREVAQGQAGYFGLPMATPLMVGDAAFARRRWTGRQRGATLTGVLACGTLGRLTLVVHFVDGLSQATTRFPAIRAALRALSPRAATP